MNVVRGEMTVHYIAKSIVLAMPLTESPGGNYPVIYLNEMEHIIVLRSMGISL